MRASSIPTPIRKSPTWRSSCGRVRPVAGGPALRPPPKTYCRRERAPIIPAPPVVESPPDLAPPQSPRPASQIPCLRPALDLPHPEEPPLSYADRARSGRSPFAGAWWWVGTVNRAVVPRLGRGIPFTFNGADESRYLAAACGSIERQPGGAGSSQRSSQRVPARMVTRAGGALDRSGAGVSPGSSAQSSIAG